ncbi:MAG: PRC-barrel domain-containing protein [Martelella sp.]|uniref:PRC-barrel domain-containing protein n=1 Tax=Martelella sp. TaxID=1969699 RepID=UPI0032426081
MTKTKLMAAVAACAMMTTGAYAANTTGNDAMPGNVDASGTPSAMTGNFLQADSEDMLGSDLIGATVYTGANDDEQTLGDVSDVLVGPDGNIEGIIIGVGGFLGIGEKDVAIPFGNVEQNTDDQGMLHLTVETSRDELENAPEFDYGAVTPDAQMVTPSGTDSTATGNSGSNGASTGPSTGTGDDTASGDAGTDAATDMPSNDLAGSATEAGSAGSRNMEQLAREDMRADDLLGATVYGENGDDVGDIGDVIVDPEGEIQAFIVDVGGFLGLGEKEVAMSPDNLDFRQDGGTIMVYTRFTEDQLNDQPEYDPDEFEQNPDEFLMR